MYSRVNLSIFLLTSFWEPFSPNDKSCVKTSFERSMYPNGRSNAKTPARRFVVEPQTKDKATCKIVGSYTWVFTVIALLSFVTCHVFS